MKLNVSLTSSRKRLSASPAVPCGLRGPEANIIQASMLVRTITREAVVKVMNAQLVR